VVSRLRALLTRFGYFITGVTRLPRAKCPRVALRIPPGMEPFD
jgi:hypothetical protein